MPINILTAQIREALKVRGLSVYWLSKQLGNPSVFDWMSGRRQPKIANLLLMAQALGIKISL